MTRRIYDQHSEWNEMQAAEDREYWDRYARHVEADRRARMRRALYGWTAPLLACGILLEVWALTRHDPPDLAVLAGFIMCIPFLAVLTE